MNDSLQKNQLLRAIPSVDHILETAKNSGEFQNIPKSVITKAVRQTIQELRNKLLAGNRQNVDLSDAFIIKTAKERAEKLILPNLKKVINGTGVVVHTNLGRSLLPAEAAENLLSAAFNYSNLEFDLAKGKRGSRYSIVEDILCEITNAQAAVVVNNNAGAVFLCLDTIAKNREVIVSRGELVEIGGSFRIPDVMIKSGCVLKEVGTTNRTHFHDYAGAVNENTALILKVHKSNYSMVGFTSETDLKSLTKLGKDNGIPVMEDLGSGTFVDFSKYGLTKEPTVQDSVSAQADIITFSGDKLLGGPQAGIIIGKKQIIEKIKKNPLARALRIDKMTLAALESVLHIYRDSDSAVEKIPTLKMITKSVLETEKSALKLEKILKSSVNGNIEINIIDSVSKAGGGALPLLGIPGKAIAVKINAISAGSIEKKLRENDPPIIGRIENETFILDLRTIFEKDFDIICEAFKKLT